MEFDQKNIFPKKQTMSDAECVKSLKTKEKELYQAVIEKNGKKFCAISMEHSITDGLLWLPVVAWNSIFLILIDKIIPGGNPVDKSTNFKVKILYAVSITIISSIIVYLNYRRKLSACQKSRKIN